MLEQLFTLSAILSLLLYLCLTATMKNITLFLVFTSIFPSFTKRNKPVLPARIPATSLDTSDIVCHSNSLLDEEVHKTKTMLDTETWFRPCDCGGPGWEKIIFYDFSQQECPNNFTRLYGQYKNASCGVEDHNRYDVCGDGGRYYSSSLPLPVEEWTYSSVCGRISGHGNGGSFSNAIVCNYSLEQAYVSGVSLTHGPSGKRRHIWTFAAACADGDRFTSSTLYNCGCSNTNMNWTHTIPNDIRHDYFCDSSRHTEELDSSYMMTITCGMGKDVAQAAVVVNGRTHLTSANASTIQHLRTSKSDSFHFMITF